MSKDITPNLQHLLDDLAVIQERVPASQDDLASNGILLDAILMRFVDAGEQLIHIREQFPNFYTEHETEAWHRLIGVRNIIAHGYNEVSPDIIWQIASEHLVELNTQIRQLMDQLPPVAA